MLDIFQNSYNWKVPCAQRNKSTSATSISTDPSQLCHSQILNSYLNSLATLLNHARLPSQETPSILSQLVLDPRYIASGRTQCRTPSPLLQLQNTSIFACLFVAAGICLPSRYLAMNVNFGSTITAFRSHVIAYYLNKITHLLASF
jgi:hypothetical protein